MRPKLLLVAWIALILLPVEISAGTTPPNLVNLSFDPQVDLTTGPSELTFSIEAIDNLSGINWGEPGTQISIRNPSNAVYSAVFTGNNNAGEATFSFEETAAPGLWRIGLIILRDVAGNQSTYSNNDLASLGYETTFEVINPNGDGVPPNLLNLSLDPQVDLTTGPSELTFSIEAIDNLSGINWGEPGTQISIRNPSNASFSAVLTGDNNAGEATFSFEETAAPGLWRIDRIILRDVAGNQSTYSNNDLASLGYETTFEVINPNGDGVPPNLVNLSFDPQVDLTAGPTSLTFSIEATDNLSGINWGEPGTQISIRNPSNASFSAVFTGNNNAGEATFSFEETAAPGLWRIGRIILRDAAGNQSVYSNSELASLGFETDINVTSAMFPGADLALSVSQNTQNVERDTRVESQFTINNLGPEPSIQPIFEFQLDQTLEFNAVSIINSGALSCAIVNTFGTCFLTDLEPGEAFGLTLTYIPRSAADTHISLSTRSSTADPDLSNNQSSIELTVFADTDGDGLTDQEEEDLGTNPLNPDSDFDGLSDGYEVSLGLNPLDRCNGRSRALKLRGLRHRLSCESN